MTLQLLWRVLQLLQAPVILTKLQRHLCTSKPHQAELNADTSRSIHHGIWIGQVNTYCLYSIHAIRSIIYWFVSVSICVYLSVSDEAGRYWHGQYIQNTDGSSWYSIHTNPFMIYWFVSERIWWYWSL